MASRTHPITGGKDADLMLLAANPLADIANVCKIMAVVSRSQDVCWPT